MGANILVSMGMDMLASMNTIAIMAIKRNNYEQAL